MSSGGIGKTAACWFSARDIFYSYGTTLLL
jgi:hypothetical protein